MKKKYNTIIDKEAMYDLMVRLNDENIAWKLINDRIVFSIYEDCIGLETFEIVIFKDRLNDKYPWNVHLIEDDRDYRIKNIDRLIGWLGLN